MNTRTHKDARDSHHAVRLEGSNTMRTRDDLTPAAQEAVDAISQANGHLRLAVTALARDGVVDSEGAFFANELSRAIRVLVEEQKRIASLSVDE